MSEFHAEAPQATASDGLAQGPYVSAMTLRTTGVESTNEPPRLHKVIIEKRLCFDQLLPPLALPNILVCSPISLTSLRQCFYAFLGFSKRNRFIWAVETRTSGEPFEELARQTDTGLFRAICSNPDHVLRHYFTPKNHPAIICVHVLTFSIFHPRTLGTLSHALFTEHCNKATAT